MAPSFRDLQLTSVNSGGRKPASIAAVAGEGDLEDVGLLDSYEDDEESGKGDILGEGMKEIQLSVSGMTCAACSNSVEGALKSVNGVLRASVALLQNKAVVVFDPKLVKVRISCALLL